MTQIYLFETIANLDGGSTLPIRYCSGVDGYNHPSAPGFFEGGLSADTTGVGVQVSIFSGNAFGAGTLDYGVIEVNNEDGDCDAWLGYGWGSICTLKLGDSDAAYDTFVTVLSARAADVIPSDSLMTINLESRLVELADQASPATYAGTNVGTTGLESTADALGGQRKIRTSGRIIGVSPDLLNASLRIYGWNHNKDGSRAPSHSLDSAMVSGEPWTLGTDYASSALLAASTPSQGYYNTCLAESLVMMGGSVTISNLAINVTVETLASDRYAASQLKKYWLDQGVATGDISQSDIDALNAIAPYEVGILIRDETYQAVCDLIAASVAGWYVPDRFNAYRCGQVAAPESVTPASSFVLVDLATVIAASQGELITVTCDSANSDFIPAKQVQIQYGQNHTPLSDTEVAAGVTDPVLRAALEQEWQVSDTGTIAAVAAKYNNAQILTTLQTALCDKTAADAIRDVVAAIYSTRRYDFPATVAFDPTQADALAIGSVLQLTYPKYGMEAGKPYRILGSIFNADTSVATVKAWG